MLAQHSHVYVFFLHHENMPTFANKHPDVYGKRVRAFFHRHDPIAMCRLKEFDALLRRPFRKSPATPSQ